MAYLPPSQQPTSCSTSGKISRSNSDFTSSHVNIRCQLFCFTIWSHFSPPTCLKWILLLTGMFCTRKIYSSWLFWSNQSVNRESHIWMISRSSYGGVSGKRWRRLSLAVHTFLKLSCIQALAQEGSQSSYGLCRIGMLIFLLCFFQWSWCHDPLRWCFIVVLWVLVCHYDRRSNCCIADQQYFLFPCSITGHMELRWVPL